MRNTRIYRSLYHPPHPWLWDILAVLAILALVAIVVFAPGVKP